MKIEDNKILNIIDEFSRFANKYNEYSTIQSKVASYLTSKIKVKNYDKILDLGCGDGEIYRKLDKSISFHKL